MNLDLKATIQDFEIDGFSLKVSICGKNSPAIVIGSHKYYPRTFSYNLGKKLQLIYVDTRGFTKNDPVHNEADFTLEKIIQDIEMIRQKLGFEKIILIGHSIHAFMALEYAKKYPNVVSHLVLIASSPISGPDLFKEADRYFDESVSPERKITFAKNMEAFLTNDDQSFTRRMLAFGPRLWYSHAFDASHLWEEVEMNNLGSDIIWGTMFTNYETARVVRNIKCPVFLALGRFDYFNPPHLWEKYRENFSDLTIRIFEKSSHTPQLEEPDNFDRELMEWF